MIGNSLSIATDADFKSNDLGKSANQRSVAGHLQGIWDSGAPGFDQGFLSLSRLSSVSAFTQALDSLSGEVHASTAGVLVDESRYVRGAVLGRLRQAPFDSGAGPLAALGVGGPELSQAEAAYAADFSVKGVPFALPPASALTFWAQGFGAWGKIEGDGNAANVDRTLGAAFVGVDHRFGGDWRLGFAAGYSQSSIAVDARQSSATVDSAHVALYGSKSFGAWNLRGGAAYAHHQIDTRRTIPGLGSTTTDHDGGTGQVFGELGYRTDAFTEAPGPAALVGRSITESVGYSTLGARFATTFALANGMAVMPRLSAGWQHAFDDVTPVATLAFASGTPGFGITGAPLARDSALIEAGADLRISPRATLGVSYVGQLARNAEDHAVKGKFVWNF